MSDTDDEFRVRLGRIGNRCGRKAVGYVKRVRKIAAKAGAGRPHRQAAFIGSRIGRGHAQGAVSAIQRPAGARRVVVKARIVHIKAGHNGAARAHLRYIQRDGVTREGEPASCMTPAAIEPTVRRSQSGAGKTGTTSGLSSLRKTAMSLPISSRSCVT